MPTCCTRCEHTDSNGNLLPKYRGLAWEDSPCSKCELVHGESVLEDVDRTNHGRVGIALEALINENGEDFDEAEDTGWGDRMDRFREDSMRGVIQAATAEVVRHMAELNKNDLFIFVQRLSGRDGVSIGRDPDLAKDDGSPRSKQAIAQRLERIRVKHGVLGRAVPKCKGCDPTRNKKKSA